jgi:hypothetical protein
MAALWKFTHDELDRTDFPPEVVVKQIMDYRETQYNGALDDETTTHQLLSDRDPFYIVKFVAKGNSLTVETLKEMGVRNNHWQGHTHRIITEYSEKGDLRGLIRRRRKL